MFNIFHKNIRNINKILQNRYGIHFTRGSMNARYSFQSVDGVRDMRRYIATKKANFIKKIDTIIDKKPRIKFLFDYYLKYFKQLYYLQLADTSYFSKLIIVGIIFLAFNFLVFLPIMLFIPNLFIKDYYINRIQRFLYTSSINNTYNCGNFFGLNLFYLPATLLIGINYIWFAILDIVLPIIDYQGLSQLNEFIKNKKTFTFNFEFNKNNFSIITEFERNYTTSDKVNTYNLLPNIHYINNEIYKDEILKYSNNYKNFFGNCNLHNLLKYINVPLNMNDRINKLEYDKYIYILNTHINKLPTKTYLKQFIIDQKLIVGIIYENNVYSMRNNNLLHNNLKIDPQLFSTYAGVNFIPLKNMTQFGIENYSELTMKT